MEYAIVFLLYLYQLFPFFVGNSSIGAWKAVASFIYLISPKTKRGFTWASGSPQMASPTFLVRSIAVYLCLVSAKHLSKTRYLNWFCFSLIMMTDGLCYAFWGVVGLMVSTSCCSSVQLQSLVPISWSFWMMCSLFLSLGCFSRLA